MNVGTIGEVAIAETRGLARFFGRLVVAFGLLSGMIAAPAWAQSPASAAAENPPRQVDELLELLDDPAVRDWLEAQRNADHAPRPPSHPRRRGSKAILAGASRRSGSTSLPSLPPSRDYRPISSRPG